MIKSFTLLILSFLILNISSIKTNAQGVTTGTINGIVKDKDGSPMQAATILANHNPSGTVYGASSRVDGRFSIPGMRVGGPYSVTISYVGYKTQVYDNIFLALGVATDIEAVLYETNYEIDEIAVTGQRDGIFSSDRTGAATSITTENLENLPTISRRIEDFTRLTPQASGNSFSGQDNRLNNITVDGSYFNNSFGLAGQPGDRTNVAPISLDAIEQIQVNVAPFDVRQGNFVGAGINTVTKSGNNDFSGSVYYQFRNEAQVGTRADENNFDVGKFKFNQIGVRLSGPIVKNKLFFFASFEKEDLIQPGTTFLANTGGQTVGGSVTRVLASDLNQLSSYLKSNFNYDTGPYQGYDHEVPALRALIRLDYNIDQKNKISLRYTHLDSKTDVLLSNSSSLGFGSRRSNTTGLNFQNSNYQILEDIRSIVGEWNSTIGDNMTNNLVVGYTSQDESRDTRGTMFPMVDILEGSSVYTTFGFEPFTPNNELRYKSFQLQNNLTYYLKDHYITFGLSLESYKSENVFFPGSQSVYVYNSLADFYTDANDYLANPTRTVSPVSLARFQVRWSNIPGQTKPIQPLEVLYGGLYVQDEWQVNPDLRLTLGLRVDVPKFGNTGFKNSQVDTLFFRDETGATVQYKTDKLPDANFLFSPRFGFNWDVMGNRSTQVRGGSGIFTSRPAYVWISNQIGENGVLTGFEQINNTNNRPFNPNINHYKPSSVNGDPASSYGLAFTDPNFKFPQIWRSNIAVDQQLPFGFIATGEFIYNKDFNGIYYINANLADPNTAFTGVDNRPRWTTGNRINSNISSAVVLKNQDVGKSWNFSAVLERPFSNGLYLKFGYNFGESKSTVDPGSIAFGSWNNNQHSSNPNNPGLGYSLNSAGNRYFGAVSFKFGNVNDNGSRFGATTVSVFFESAHPAPADPNVFGSRTASYVFSGDINGDGGTSNDLIYIPRDISEMNFQEYTVGTRTYTAAEQAAAWEAYILQDEYLSKNRGQYAERGGLMLPMVFRLDLSLIQDFYVDFLNRRNTLQFRLDILNVGNLLNREWGVSDRFVTTSPLLVPTSAQGGPADAQGRAQYRLRTIGGNYITKSLEKNATINDVFRIQFGFRYIFN